MFIIMIDNAPVKQRVLKIIATQLLTDMSKSYGWGESLLTTSIISLFLLTFAFHTFFPVEVKMRQSLSLCASIAAFLGAMFVTTGCCSEIKKNTERKNKCCYTVH
jgi:hypothetical protein